MEKDELILTAENIHREFVTGDTTLGVLNGLSLKVKRGETVAVTGASGVGKSTLLHILGGLDRPTKGDVTLGSIDLNQQSETELAKLRNQKVGFVFQFHHLLQNFTACENVMIPMLVAGCSIAEATRKSELLLAQVGLSSRTTHRPSQLSGGEQQRVAVARALANDPEVVLADEPSGNLDTATGRQLHDLLFKLNEEQGTTFVVATHNTELAQQCGREATIVAGQMSLNAS